MKKFVFVIAMVFLSVACNEDSVQYVKISELKPGEKVEIIFLTGEKEFGQMREDEVLKKLSTEIAGKKKIVAIKTVYKNGFLFSAEIIYVFTEKESGMKIKYLTSNAKHSPDREKEIKSLLEGMIKEISNITAIQSVYKNGHLIAAEIYHQ